MTAEPECFGVTRLVCFRGNESEAKIFRTEPFFVGLFCTPKKTHTNTLDFSYKMRSFLFGVLSWIWFASTPINAQNCDICGGNTLPDFNVILSIGPATIAQCEANLDPTFCSLLSFISGFTCGEVQTNPALANEFCPEFSATLGVSCNCNTPDALNGPIPTIPPEPTESPTAAPLPSGSRLADFIRALIAFFSNLFG